MDDRRIDFEEIEWERPAKGIAQKIYISGNNRIRLIRFEDDFIEKDWCVKAHVGYVLDGEMKIDFNKKRVYFKKGDGLWIDKGEKSKHKVIIEKGAFVEIILFEAD